MDIFTSLPFSAVIRVVCCRLLKITPIETLLNSPLVLNESENHNHYQAHLHNDTLDTRVTDSCFAHKNVQLLYTDDDKLCGTLTELQ